MQEEFSRSSLLWGEDGNNKLQSAHVAVFGAGGVGGFAVEALARAGVGAITVVDSDIVAKSNINRQIIATQHTLGAKKVLAARDRILSINPTCKVNAVEMFYLPENAHEMPLSNFDYVIDAIDTVSAKIELIVRATAENVPIVSAMGCGNKLDPTAFCVTDIYKTQMDPLARVMRRELKQRGVKALKVVYSTEKALVPQKASELELNVDENCEVDLQNGDTCNNSAKNKTARKKSTPGSVSFVPPVAGFILAGVVIKDIVGVNVL